MSEALPGLDQLRELPLPAPVPYWPETWGWAVLAVLLLAGGAWAAAVIWRRRHRNLYRRQALQALRQLARATAEDSLAARGLPALLKRTALAAQPPDGRAAVASLSGEPWIRYLEHDVPAGFPKNAAELMRLLAYAPDDAVRGLDGASLSQLIRASREWVVKHHVEA
ncbi:MAG: DUF4381 domain-containing protein [Achromobacter sp.]|jgi:hypothetical protein|uniref:DUF4381 domain-containing protein n=1 Tax=Achromobacter sp. TaxID=134375 RepID=UPI003D013738